MLSAGKDIIWVIKNIDWSLPRDAKLESVVNGYATLSRPSVCEKKRFTVVTETSIFFAATGAYI